MSNCLKYFLNLLFAFACFNTMTHTQVINLGSCPFPTVMSGFDPTQVSSITQFARKLLRKLLIQRVTFRNEYSSQSLILLIFSPI